MNYRHAYHAGNFADVIKHVILTALLTAMSQKKTPFCYIDTHAGPGCYDLFSALSSKTKEYEGGIEKIMRQDNPPPLVKPYLSAVHTINNQLTHSRFSSLRYYPGSPLIAQSLLRPTDRLVACELHPEEYRQLRSLFLNNKLAAVHHMDGFLGLKAFLPPAERRGVILIDPPYEDPDEFTRLARTLPLALKRFETGIYAIWYPLKEKASVQRFYQSLSQHVLPSILAIELTLFPDLPHHLNGCGLAVINPPWQFEQSLNDVLPWLWNALTINHQGGFKAFLLK